MTVRLEISFYVRSCSDIASLTACLGTTLGYLIILMPAVEGDDPEIKVTTEELTWISSLDLVLIAIGCLVSGSMSQYLGRKKAMILSNIPFVIAWVIFYYSTNSAMLFVALTINGLTGGLLEAPVLTYGAEVTQPNLRGMLSATSTMSLMFGTFTQILSGRWAHWRMVAMINLFYPIVCFIALCLVPESPYWLAAKGRFAESEQALCWLRGWTSPSQVQDEFQIICETVRKSADNASSNKKEIWRSYTKRTFYLPFILMIVIMLIYSFGGAMSTQTFAVHLFERYDTPINKYTATVFLGIAQLLGTLVCIMVIRFLGKRKLTFLSLSCTSLCFLAIAIYGFLNEADYIDKVKYTWIPTALLIFLAFVLNFGIRSLPWILVGEIYPLDVRSGATAASVLLGYILMAIANKIFLNMVDGMTLSGTFLFYSVINLVGICFLYIMLPETENRTFKEIEEHFAGVQNLKNRPKKKQHVIDETSAVVNPAFLHDENIENKL